MVLRVPRSIRSTKPVKQPKQNKCCYEPWTAPAWGQPDSDVWFGFGAIYEQDASVVRTPWWVSVLVTKLSFDKPKDRLAQTSRFATLVGLAPPEKSFPKHAASRSKERRTNGKAPD
jgi:hypothetical protein